MAKGDHARMDNRVQEVYGTNSNHLGNLRRDNITQTQHADNNWRRAIDAGWEGYDEMMAGYRNIAAGGGAGVGGAGGGPIGPSKLGPMDQKYRGYVDKSLAGYEQFSKDGGFNDQAIADMRARAISPTRAVYANAQRNMDRSKALQGGYAPNYIAAQAKTARDLGQSISDANTNANAEIAQMVQQGRLAGLSGMQQGGFGQQGIDLDIAKTNASLAAQAAAAARANANARASAAGNSEMAGLRAMQGLWESAPGMAQLYGNQMQQGMDNWLAVEGLNNQLGGLAINGQNMVSNTAGNWQSAMGNIGSGLNLVGQVGGIIPGVGSLLPRGAQNPYADTRPYYGPGY